MAVLSECVLARAPCAWSSRRWLAGGTCAHSSKGSSTLVPRTAPEEELPMLVPRLMGPVPAKEGGGGQYPRLREPLQEVLMAWVEP